MNDDLELSDNDINEEAIKTMSKGKFKRQKTKIDKVSFKHLVSKTEAF